VSEEHAGEVVTLKDIEAARRAHRRSLRAAIDERVARVADFLPRQQNQQTEPVRPAKPAPSPARPRLRFYAEDDP
jgi:putative transposase